MRDAIGRLEQENLVTIYPKKGILVAPVLPKDISSLFQLRMMWEPYAVQKYGNMLSCDFYMSFYDYFFQGSCFSGNFFLFLDHILTFGFYNESQIYNKEDGRCESDSYH